MRTHMCDTPIKTLVRRATHAAIVDRLSGYDAAVEVGVGRRPDVAAALAETGLSVTATDLRERSVPAPVHFVRDDVTDPDLSVYAAADVVYALALPAELQRPTVAVARAIEADCRFTTLGADHPILPATPATLPGETLYTPETSPVAENVPEPGDRAGADRTRTTDSERA
jgi:uncharacterized UPF0146 family protein